jgi:membrane protein
MGEAVTQWRRDRAQRMAAALAFYTAFSLAPLLIIAVAMAGFFFREETARSHILDQVRDFAGPRGAEAVQEMMMGASRPSSGVLATILSVGLLLFGAARIFAQLQSAMDSIWKVPPRPSLDVRSWVRKRLVSVSMVLAMGTALLLSLLAAAALSTALTFFRDRLPGIEAVWVGVNFITAFLVTSAFFAALFKILPAVKVAWKDVWMAALGTTVLFVVGRALLGLYLSWGLFHSVYGAAGSIVVILLWVYYSAQILLLGAEFAHVYAVRYGSLAGASSRDGS